MYETQKIDEITKMELVSRVQTLIAEAYRLVQICATQEADVLCVDYTFDKGNAFYDLRLRLPKDDLHLPSISQVCFPAFLYENELHDLFGIKIEGIAVDFAGKFYRVEQDAPFMKEEEAQ